MTEILFFSELLVSQNLIENFQARKHVVYTIFHAQHIQTAKRSDKRSERIPNSTLFFCQVPKAGTVHHMQEIVHLKINLTLRI